MSSFLSSVNDINIAHLVDIDGVQAANHPQYLQTVEKARILLRTLEASVQALFDDSASLLVIIEAHRTPYAVTERERISQYEYVDAMLASIRSNLGVVISVLDSLVAIGHDQAEVGQQSYRNSIEWRRSRISIVDGNFDAIPQTLMPQEDVVDMELAFSNQGSSRAVHPLDTASSTMYSGSAYSESTLDVSDGGGDPMTPTWSQEPSEASTLAGTQHSPTAESFIFDEVLEEEGGRKSYFMLENYGLLDMI